MIKLLLVILGLWLSFIVYAGLESIDSLLVCRLVTILFSNGGDDMVLGDVVDGKDDMVLGAQMINSKTIRLAT